MNTDKEIVNKISVNMRRYSIESKLNTIRKLSHIVDWTDSNPNMVNGVFPELKYFGLEKYNILKRCVYNHELEYLALISIVDGEAKGFNLNFGKYSEFRKIMNIYKEYSPPILKNSDIPLENFLVKLSFQQFHSQSNHFFLFYKYNYFFTYKSQKIDMEETFKSYFKYDYIEYIKLVFTMFIISSLSLNEFIMKPESELLMKCLGFSEDKVIEMYCVLGRNRTQIKEEYEKYRTDELSMRIFDYNPLKKYPMLFLNLKWYIPIPYLLFEAITEGFFHRICDRAGIHNFKGKFGKNVFEAYINDILLISKEKFEIIPEFEYKKDTKTVDFILSKNNDLILVEVKSSMPTLKIRYGTEEEFKNEIVKTYKIALEQCIKNEKLIRNCIIKDQRFPNEIENIFYLIITPDDYYIPTNNTITKVISENLKDENKKVLENKKYHFIGCDDLEDLFINNGSIFELLKNRENGKYRWEDNIGTQIKRKKRKNKDDRRIEFYNNIFDNVEKNVTNNIGDVEL